MPDILSLIVIFVSFSIVLILPTWTMSVRINRGHHYSRILPTALILGFSSQSILGFFWDHFVRASLQSEVLVYFSFWLVLTVIPAFFFPAHLQCREEKQRCDWLLPVLICAAILLRSIHPLQHMALGQSDAYSHLQFLRNVIELGSIRHHIYPPGYHWVLVLPVFPFQLEPYDIARFSGAFFGSCLVLAVFVLMKELSGYTAAIIAAFCVACFPLFNLLIKTGIGSFANQLGLFYLPAIYYFFYKAVTDSFQRRSVNILFCFSLAGLAVTVPIMLISIAIVIIASLVFLWRHKRIKEFLYPLVLLVLPPLVILCIHLGHAGWLHQRQALSHIIGNPKERQESIHIEKNKNNIQAVVSSRKIMEIQGSVALLTGDFFSVKRWGFRDRIFTAAGLGCFAIFFFFLWRGVLDSSNSYILMGVWGLLASVQTLTGFAQFSNYQREGWSLMVAAAGALGVVGERVFQASKYQRVLKVIFFVLLGVSVSWGVMHPPGHFILASSAEDQIVRVIRAVSMAHGQVKIKDMSNADQRIQRILSMLEMQAPVTLISRKMSGWRNSGQGELIRAIVGHRPGLDALAIHTPGDLEKMIKKDTQYIFFIDHDVADGHENIAFANINPVQVDRSLRQRKELQEGNQIIESFIKGLDSKGWNIRVVPFDSKLDVYVMKQRNNEA